jgi:hypothetical protein
MTTGILPADPEVRHNPDDLPVTTAMARWSFALPIIRALILAGIVIVLIMFGLPRVLAIAAAASL